MYDTKRNARISLYGPRRRSITFFSDCSGYGGVIYAIYNGYVITKYAAVNYARH